MKKKLLWGFCLTVCLCLAAGCGSNKENLKELESIKQEKETVTLDWYINYSWFTTPWGENLVSQKITQETGVNINFITPIGNETEKLNALIASDSLPDLITLGYWEPQVEQMISNQMVYALNELADEYDPYFWQVADPDVVNWYTKEDGIYMNIPILLRHHLI